MTPSFRIREHYSPDTTFHEFDHNGKHYQFVYDEYYEPMHSGCPEHGDEDLADEIAKVTSGEWVALGCIVTAPCPGSHHEGHPDSTDPKAHCPACSGFVKIDSLWGIVIDNSTEAAETFVREEME